MKHGYTSHNHPCCGEARLSQKRTDVLLHRCGGPRLCKTVCFVQANQIHSEAETKRCEEPHLGLATTERILEELIARGEIQTYADEYRTAGQVLHDECKRLLNELPPALRAYRTVDYNWSEGKTK